MYQASSEIIVGMEAERGERGKREQGRQSYGTVA